jgi:hypothetical protein
VSTAQSITDAGVTSQRLTIRFERAGAKTISTLHAPLTAYAPGPADLGARPRSSEDASMPVGSDPLSAASDLSPETIARLPDAATDPFSTPRRRLAATLDLYKFSDRGGSLLDWASIQTGLKDPLSRFSRHELEQLFQRFQINLDQHLRRLIRDLKRTDPAVLADASASAVPAAQQALRRCSADR